MDSSSSTFCGESFKDVLVVALNISRAISKILARPDPRCGVLMKIIPAT